jgi:hypothetical protein
MSSPHSTLVTTGNTEAADQFGQLGTRRARDRKNNTELNTSVLASLCLTCVYGALGRYDWDFIHYL